MRLQSIIFTDKNQCAELYYRGELSLAEGEILTFNTYFNSFSYTKYRDYTTIDSVVFSCRLSGKARVDLCVFDGTEKIISSIVGENELQIVTDFSQLPGKGILYPKITAVSKCEFIEGEYSSPCNPDCINVCIAICTYKREDYVTNNIKLLKNADFKFIKHVFVSDNGNTLDHNTLSDDFVSVLPNKNYGGSGGFTRGLIEAYNGGYSHVILMDDDVEFHAEILETMTVFASLLKEEYKKAHFSAAMLSENTPYIQFELGGSWNGIKMDHKKHNVDVRNINVLLDNLDNNNVEYGAWWCFMIPVSDIDDYNLPYPFFIKFDDVEYGLRTCKNEKIITMNGIAVRHEDFENKYSFHLEYYNVRNKLITNVVQNRKNSLFSALYRLFGHAAYQLFLYRYENTDIILRAFDDFLKGVDFFLSCDEELLNKELMSSVPELVALDTVDEWTDDMRNYNYPKTRGLTPIIFFTLGGHLIPGFWLKKDIAATPLSKTQFCGVFRNKVVIQYQYKSNYGIVTRRSIVKFLKYSTKVLGMSFKLLFCYNKACTSFQNRKTEITSLDYWKTHLDLK